MACKCYHAYKNFLGETGVCWGTKEGEACSCDGDEAKCDLYDYVRKRARKQVTNGDRLRSMTDEELAEFIAHYDSYTALGEELAKVRWLDWLKAEYKEE